MIDLSMIAKEAIKRQLTMWGVVVLIMGMVVLVAICTSPPPESTEVMQDNSFEWRTYPAGADVFLFEGAMHLVITKNKHTGKWEVSLTRSSGAGGGYLFPVRDAKTCEEAMRGAEAWVREQSP